MKIAIIILLSFCAVAVLFAMLKSGHFVKSLLICTIKGIFSLIAVNVIALASGVSLSLNAFTLGMASIFGIPGTITFLLLRIIFLKL